VLPTRIARNGTILTDDGRVTVTRSALRKQEAPLDPTCDCYACAHFSAAYVHHLFKAQELLAYRLASIHNLRYMARLSTRMRQAILAGQYGEWRRAFLGRYRVSDAALRQQQREKRLSAWTAARPALDRQRGDMRRDHALV
jgi:queuine tRNA-ribosyltransferase